MAPIRRSYTDLLVCQPVNRLARLKWQCLVQHIYVLKNIFIGGFINRVCFMCLYKRCSPRNFFDVIVGAIASYELVADLIGKLYRSQDRLSRGANGQSHYRPSRWGPAEHYRTLWLCEWPVKDSRLPISCLCHKGLNFICDIAKTSWFQREIPVVRHPVTSPCAASLLG